MKMGNSDDFFEEFYLTENGKPRPENFDQLVAEWQCRKIPTHAALARACHCSRQTERLQGGVPHRHRPLLPDGAR